MGKAYKKSAVKRLETAERVTNNRSGREDRASTINYLRATLTGLPETGTVRDERYRATIEASIRALERGAGIEEISGLIARRMRS